jgi:hypothetical protein
VPAPQIHQGLSKGRPAARDQRRRRVVWRQVLADGW